MTKIAGWLQMNRRALVWTAITTAALILVIEIGVRIAGLTDFPVYVRMPGVAYVLAPSQHGAFLRKTHWFVNDKSFANANRFSSVHPNCLLVGDSVVYGGNYFDYERRIGRIAEKSWGHPIWVAAVGGWNLINELAFLRMHVAEVRSADHIIFVLNNGDFDEPAPWTGELSFPTYHPVFAGWYIARRYLLPHPSELPGIGVQENGDFEHVWTKQFDALLESYDGPITIFLYPEKTLLGDGLAWNSKTMAIRNYVLKHRDRIEIVDLRDGGTLSPTKYHDAIHPNFEGNKTIAALVARSCSSSWHSSTRMQPIRARLQFNLD
jgi:hypothetical protein